jgi:peptidyl-prolyl isomerase D
LDGKHVVFGEVIKGKSLGTTIFIFSLLFAHFFQLKVRQVENYPTSSGDVPTTPITISDCGVLSPDDPSLQDDPAAQVGDPYEDYPVDEDRDTENPETALQIAQVVREVGNNLFKNGKAEEALEKYQSEDRHYFIIPTLESLTDTWVKESLRYLDVHPVLQEGSPEELQEKFNALLAPLLLNSALAAIRAQPPSTANFLIAVSSATRALGKLPLSDADKGTIYLPASTSRN